jgi:hypothetical protein
VGSCGPTAATVPDAAVTAFWTSSYRSRIRQPRICSASLGRLYIGAIELAAAKRKITLLADVAVDAEIDPNLADGAFFLAARLNVSLPASTARSRRS